MIARAATALLLLLLAGCLGNFTQKDDEKSLQATLRAYEETLRWGHIEQIYDFLDPQLATGAPRPRGLKNIKVTGYQVLQPPAKVAEDKAGQTVEILYVHIDEQVQKSLTDRQLWRYYKDRNRWTRINPIPPFH